MKHCPSCQTNYADDTLQFCLQDGTQLAELSNASTPTIAFNDAEAETVVRLKEPGQNREQPSLVTQISPKYVASQAQPQKSNTWLVVLLTVLVMFLLFGSIVGAWLFLGSRKNVANVANVGNKDFPTPNRTPANINSNASPTPSPSKTPTPAPGFDAEEIKSEVSDEMYAWKSSMESGSLNSVMSHYAGNLDYYYKGSSTSSSTVRSNKQKAFDIYYSFAVNIGNMSITPDASGQKATVVFNKSWVFKGSEKNSTGTVRAQFQLTKMGGKWFITGEKDL